MHKLLTKKINKYKILLSNLGYLSIIKLINLVIPLLIFPYLIRVLGKENYGLVIYTESILTYFVIIINYGFNLSATKEIAINRSNKSKVNEIISSVYILKFLLLLLSITVLIILSLFFDILKENSLLLTFTTAICIYEFLNPIWYFQGVEKLKPITIINFISKIIFVTLIFLLIKQPRQYILVPLINGFSTIIPLMIILYILYKKEKIKVYVPQKKILVKYFKEGSLYFTSSISIQVFTNTNRFIIGSFIGLDKLAIYDIVEKFIRILSVPTSMLRQVLLPYVSLNKDKKIIRKTTVLMTLLSIIITTTSLLFADDISRILLGSNSELAMKWIKLYLPIIILYNIGNYYGVVSLNAFNLQKKFLQATLYSVFFFCIGILGIYFLIHSFNVSLLIINSLMTESVFIFYVYKYVIKNDLF
jgi:O-antigen/teichoic acid export membrane protein